MPIADVEHNPWEAAAPAAPAGQIADVSHNPWETPSVPLDVAKSAGVGLGEGAIGTLGSVGDVRSLLSSGVSYLGGKLGISPETIQAGKQAFASALPGGQAVAAAPTSEQIKSGVEGVTGPFYQPQTVPGEYARTVGQFAPGAVAGPGGIARRAITQALVPALASETGGQLYKGTELEPYARLAGGVGGALAGPGVIAGARKAVTPFPISAERQAALTTLRNEGVDVPAGMATGNRQLNAMQSQMGGIQQQANVEQMKEQYTAATLRKAGIDAPRATPDVLNAADDRIGSMFDAVAARNRAIPVPGFDKVAGAISGDYQRLTNQESPLLNELRGRIGSTIDGDTYQSIQSEIRRLAEKSSSPELKGALYDMKGALDAAVQGGLKNPADVQVWKDARRQWGNLKTIEKAVSGTTDVAAQGLVTPAKLTQAMQSKSKTAYVRGRGDFADLARAGNQVMKEFPDSGTASRAAALIKAASLGAGATGALSIPTALASSVAPWLVGRAITSGPGQRYLANQMLGSAAQIPLRQRLLGAALPPVFGTSLSGRQEQR